MSKLNNYQRILAQSLLAFVAGNQLVHHFMNPLGDIDQIIQKKKSELWKNYLESRESRHE